jgi:hypothetical protein
MTTLMQASREWSSRPADERFTSLTDMLANMQKIRGESHGTVISTRRFQAKPAADNKGMFLEVDGKGISGDFSPSHWSFGQVAALAKAPAGYLRNLPSPIAADCLNYGLFTRDVEDVGLLLRQNGQDTVRAATGPNYGRIWNTDIVGQLIERFGNGIEGDFRVPGEFGKAVDVTKDNTTLFASDRDMFVFLADEDHRIEIPDRRNGQPGSLARGFFCWNSEVGSATLGIGTFLFDYVCCNRIVWGAEGYKEITIRHTAGAPDKFIEEVTPAIQRYAADSTLAITSAIEKAKAARLDKDNVDDFLAKRFGRNTVQQLKTIHEQEEGRPIESLWDVTTAVTAKARSVKWQDERVQLERQAGDVMSLAS